MIHKYLKELMNVLPRLRQDFVGQAGSRLGGRDDGTTPTLHLYLSLILFLMIFVILGLPHTNWGFKTDDFSNILHSNITSWSQFFRLFYEGNIEAFYVPSNQTPGQSAFFAGLFRPLSFVYYLPQFYFFHTWAYGYYLVTIAFHALAAVLLFNFLLLITDYWLAFMLALFFGFHPSLYNWLGWTSAQTYFIELVIILTIISLLIKYLKTENTWLYYAAVGLYPCTIFLKEASIVLPFWVLIGVYLSTRKWSRALKISSGFWLVAFGYLIARAAIFPLTSNTSTLTFKPTWESFSQRMSSRLFDFVTYGVDMLGLSWLPNSTYLPTYSIVLKSMCIMFILICLFWCFIKSTQKTLILFLIFSMLLFTWPAILMHYQPRYIYLGLPFFILSLGGLLKYAPKVSTFVLALILPITIIFLHTKLTTREKTLHYISSSFQELVRNPSIHNRSICFLALPGQWFHEGSAQAIWLYRNDATYPVFQIDLDIAISDVIPGLTGDPACPSKPSRSRGNTNVLNPRKNFLNKNYMQVTQESNACIFTSTNPEKLWFITPENTHSSTATLVIDQTIVQYNPVYITWDYYEKKFIIL